MGVDLNRLSTYTLDYSPWSEFAGSTSQRSPSSTTSKPYLVSKEFKKNLDFLNVIWDFTSFNILQFNLVGTFI